MRIILGLLQTACDKPFIRIWPYDGLSPAHSIACYESPANPLEGLILDIKVTKKKKKHKKCDAFIFLTDT